MIEYIGNTALLKCRKTAFFAPGKISVASVMPSYDWATEMARSGECVISGFTSRLESDVWNFLAQGSQPIIVVLTRSKFKVVPMKYRPLLDSNRLLIIFLGYGSHPCREYAARIAQATGVETLLWDERGTSVTANRILSDAGKKRGKQRARVDAVAAQIILQSYLDYYNLHKNKE